MTDSHESRAREFLGPRADGIPESTYLRSVLALVRQAEQLEKAMERLKPPKKRRSGTWHDGPH